MGAGGCYLLVEDEVNNPPPTHTHIHYVKRFRHLDKLNIYGLNIIIIMNVDCYYYYYNLTICFYFVGISSIRDRTWKNMYLKTLCLLNHSNDYISIYIMYQHQQQIII